MNCSSSTSSTELRTIRINRPEATRPRQVIGRMSCTKLPLPMAGSHCSVTEKIRISRIPSQKVGIEVKNSITDWMT